MPPQVFDPLPAQRPPPLSTILKYPFLVADPKKFLKAPLAPIYTKFEGERALKKNAFFGEKFPKFFKN